MKEEDTISAETRLAASLRWLAGGSYLDICFAFGISDGTFYKAERGPLWPTLEAIDRELEISFPLNDEAELERISRGFSRFSHNRISGCVLAVDGLVVRSRCPSRREVRNQIAFRK